MKLLHKIKLINGPYFPEWHILNKTKRNTYTYLQVNVYNIVIGIDYFCRITIGGHINSFLFLHVIYTFPSFVICAINLQDVYYNSLLIMGNTDIFSLNFIYLNYYKKYTR